MHFFTILATLSGTAIAFPTWGRFVNGTANGEADIHKTTVGDNNIDKSRNSAAVSYDDHSPSMDLKDSNNEDNSKRPSLGSLLEKANVTVGPLTGDSPLVSGPLISLPSPLLWFMGGLGLFDMAAKHILSTVITQVPDAMFNSSMTRNISLRMAKDNVYARGTLGKINHSEGCSSFHA
ncbi:unnamed protein product [Aspergillus oryzae RIB40]|uniref:DNA, SC103 n=3 Tax=Aspergillus oryzae TaxID=5062 RepID=Q2TYH9_ASPOR|nr:unnamed protein product [Aspergillus oryzae RIB40]BAE65694.1 unnamed protein product [Aspergillus oryzae RIB40]